MTTSAGVSQPSFLKRFEASIQMALQRAAAAVAGVLALQNRATAVDTLDNQAAPAGVIIAAMQVTPRASGKFVLTANLDGTDSAADTITLQASEIAAAITGFSGGTLEQAGGGTQNLPALRFAKAGAVVATGGATTGYGAQSVTTAGAGAFVVSLASTVTAATGAPVLITLAVTATHNLSAMGLSFSCYELP